MESFLLVSPILFGFVFIILVLLATAKILAKAGIARWKAYIPIYNFVCLCRVASLSGWYAILLMVPIVGIFAYFYFFYRLGLQFSLEAKKMFFLCFPFTAFFGVVYLGFSDRKHIPTRVLGSKNQKLALLLSAIIVFLLFLVMPKKKSSIAEQRLQLNNSKISLLSY